MIVDTLITLLQYRTDKASVARAKADAGGVVEDLNAKAERARARFQRLGAGFTAVGGALTAVGAIGTGVAKAVLDVAIPFEEAMNRISAFGQRTGAELEAERQKAKEIGRTTAATAGQAADALLELAKAGFTHAEAMSAVASVTAIATTAEMEMGDAAAIVANNLRMFGLDAGQAERVVDVLSNTARSATATVPQLAYAMRVVGGTANSAGISIEDTAAAIGTLMNRGMRAESAGTAIRNMIARLIDPTGDAAKAIEELGVDVEGLKERLLSGDEGALMDVFSEMYEGLGPEAASRIFGVEGMTGALNLAGAADEARTLAQANRDAAGATAEMSEAMLEGLPGALKLMTSAIDGLKQALADTGFTDFVENVVRTVTPWINDLSERIGNASPIVKKFIVGFMALSPVLAIVGAAATAFGMALMVGMGPLLLVAGKVMLVVVALAALAAGVIYVVKNWGKIWGWIQDRLSKFRDWLSTSFIGRILSTVMPLLAIVRYWDQIKAALGAFVSWVGARFVPWIRGFIRFVSGIWGSIVDAARGAWTGISEGIRNLFGRAIDGAKGVIHSFRTWLENLPVVGGLFRALFGAGDAIRDAFEAGGIREVFGRAIQGAKSVIQDFRTWLEGLPVVGTMFQAIFSTADAFKAAFKFGGITAVFDEFKSRLLSFFNDVAGIIAGLPVIGNLFDAIFGDHETSFLERAILDPIKGLLDMVKKPIQDFRNWVMRNPIVMKLFGIKPEDIEEATVSATTAGGGPVKGTEVKPEITDPTSEAAVEFAATIGDPTQMEFNPEGPGPAPAGPAPISNPFLGGAVPDPTAAIREASRSGYDTAEGGVLARIGAGAAAVVEKEEEEEKGGLRIFGRTIRLRRRKVEDDRRPAEGAIAARRAAGRAGSSGVLNPGPFAAPGVQQVAAAGAGDSFPTFNFTANINTTSGATADEIGEAVSRRNREDYENLYRHTDGGVRR